MKMINKKVIYFVIPFLSLALIISFALACGSSGSGEPKKIESSDEITNTARTEETVATTRDSDTTTEKDIIYNIGDSVELDKIVVTVKEFKKSSGDDYDKPKDGMEYVIVTVKIINNSQDKVSYNAFDFKMQNSKGQINDMAFSIIDTDTSLGSGELISNGEAEGTIVFEEPIDDEELILIYQPNYFNDNKIIEFYIK